MPQRHSYRRSHQDSQESNRTFAHREPRPDKNWAASQRGANYAPRTSLTQLIEQDAPLGNHNHLVLMYGPFQAELVPEIGQGVATWLKDCIHKHGLPSLVRFDYRRRAQVFRRDQFQPWFDQLMKAS
ncbi:hypothetical protein ACN4EG_13940 [Alkalinema pantanalense CENA528]|uniref:hypothetical protein n=1 Tax=Alkalinema pantanalense TaxID=1620705 RepID=UPI003D6FEB58